MSNERRLVLFFLLSLLTLFGTQYLFEALGWVPKRQPPRAAGPLADLELPPREPDLGAGVHAFAGQPDSPSAFAEEVTEPALTASPLPQVQPVPDQELVLGALDRDAPPEAAYHMQVELTQRGAGVRSIRLAYHDAEIKEDRRREPLTLVEVPERWRAAVGPPLAIRVEPVRDDRARREAVRDYPLDVLAWTVVADEEGRLVRPVPADPTTGRLEGQEVVFEAEVPWTGHPVRLTKTIRLRKGSDGLEVGLRFWSPVEQTITFRLQGPYGIPIEGEWYTSTFRDAFFGKLRQGVTEIETRPANEVLDRERKGDPFRATTDPLKFAGIENQYFAVFVQPDPVARTAAERIEERAVAAVVEQAEPAHKSEITVYLESRPLALAANQPLEIGYRLFAGPKIPSALAPYGAEDLATYRKGGQIPIIGGLATLVARTVISPMLDQIYELTRVVASLFGGRHGNYGIAIILLTVVVRLLMFPLSKKQAESAKRMQDLQPQLLALRDKYKDDKEKIGRETFALYRQYGVNPFGGCLIVLIQMPIFLGLWQAVNNSVALRNARFLWIQNLAAPDQLFKFPVELPWLGPYFNVLPIAVAGLMLVHTKLFSPPATTPEQVQSQKIMKWMLILMAFMFYKVPAGLCLYFIVSSLWSIGERLLLPSMRAPIPAQPAAVEATAESGERRSGTRPGDSRASSPAVPGWRDKLRARIEQVIEEAEHERTVRRSNPPGRATDRARPKGPPSSGRRKDH
ncbi:MAG: hypothetical protein KatS3mg108_2110 [Isosphaeraceae bacterium]|jgi:YidC/Oxa1 family membrane protein insertase|nr:MAG: hypothetical protein KatS3mg108_2110 [Isosphaeraceae bacterium]